MGLSMMPLRKMRSISLAPVPDGRSFRLSSTCCMAKGGKKQVSDWAKRIVLFTSLELLNYHFENAGTNDRDKESARNYENNLSQLKTAEKTIKRCDYKKSFESKNNKCTVDQWANSQRTSLISVAAATSTKSHKEIVLLTDLPCRG